MGIIHLVRTPTLYEVQISQPSSSTALGDFTYFDRTTALLANRLVRRIGIYSTSSHTFTVKIALGNSSTNFNVVLSQGGFSHPGGGWAFVALTTPFRVPGSGNYYLGGHFNGSSDVTAALARSVVAGNQGVANGVTMTAANNVCIPLAYQYR